MDITTIGIICSAEPCGERGMVVKALTPDVGLLVGYVRAGQSRKRRPLLMPGNSVALTWHARTEAQLGIMDVELEQPRAHIMLENRVKATALVWLTALTATALPERMAYPSLYAALLAWLDVLDYADEGVIWAEALVSYELHLLSVLGFSLDLSCCAVTGRTDDLIYVSPRSARAVSRNAGRPFAEKLLALPGFVLTSAQSSSFVNDRAGALSEGFQLSGYFLERHVVHGAARCIFEARKRLIESLKSLQKI